MLDRVVWCPVGMSRAVGLHMSLAKFQLMRGTMNLKLKTNWRKRGEKLIID
jgi:hypothetical protein